MTRWLVGFWLGYVATAALAAEPAWKAGMARAVITPKQPMWLAGYGGRDRPSEGTEHDLWVKVVALEDATGRLAVVLSSDLLGIPQSIYDNVCRELKAGHGLERAQIMLTSSHTHCGPVLRGALYDAYPLDEAQRQKIEEYSAELEKTIVQTVGEALGRRAPGRLEIGSGTARFAVNRRNNPEREVPALRAKDALAGPVDHSVGVLALRKPDGALRAAIFGYACHNTVLSYYKWCGDYAGFAQIAVEERHPGADALFFMGCGADQNPLPRRQVAQARQYGAELADAVDDALRRPRRVLPPRLETAFEMLDLELGAAPTRAELAALAGGTAYSSRWAKRLLAQLDAGKPFRRTYPYPVQVWRLGGEHWWISLGGEVVVDYSLRLKKEIGPGVWVTGYANDVMAYIPSLRVLKEGGYEGASSMIVYGMPAHRWAENVEERIVACVHRLIAKVQQAQPSS